MSSAENPLHTNCENCGTELLGKYCHKCGQQDIDTHQNFFHMVGHFVSDYLHYDSKFFRSVIPLFTKPGFLTKEYWEGRRVRYIPPLRLFFFTIIFFVIAASVFYREFNPAIKAAVFKPSPHLSKVDSAYLANLTDRKLAAKLAEEKATDDRMLKKLGKGMDSYFTFLKYVTFLLLPMYAFIFYRFHKKYQPHYFQQLIFATHFQSFLYVLLTILLFIPFWFPDFIHYIIRIVLVVSLVYIIVAFHRLYRQAWWKTILKSIAVALSVLFLTAIVFGIFAGINAVFIQ